MSAAAARSNVTWTLATASTAPPLRTSAVTVAVPGSVPARSVARAWPSLPAGTTISRGVAAGAPTKAPSVVVKVTSRSSGFVRGSSWATSVTIEKPFAAIFSTEEVRPSTWSGAGGASRSAQPGAHTRSAAATSARPAEGSRVRRITIP